jgi:hypothetical protein
MLIVSLTMSGAQDILSHTEPDNGSIVLTLDTDSHDTDAFEQPSLISRTSSVLHISLDADYPPQTSMPVPPNVFPPHERPPAEHV